VRVPERKELVVLLDNTSRGDKLDELSVDLLSVLHGIAPNGPRKSIAEVVNEAVEKDGVAKAIAQYRALKASQPKAYDFAEQNALNMVGYGLLQLGRTADAIEIFKLNVEMFPEHGNPPDSLGEAYLAAGEKALALASYKRALALDPRNEGAKAIIARLEKPAAALKYPLEAFTGSYALAPNFTLKVFLEQGALKAQGTGQPAMALVADGASEFAVTGVPARLVFQVDEASRKASALVLHQGGREMPAKRLE
jgi:tetratricopeptide (TPR) repeat protein